MQRKILLVIGLLAAGCLSGQTITGDAQTDIRALRGLSDADYMHTALDFSLQYSRQGRWELADELLDAAVTKGRRSGGRAAAATVHLAYVEELLACCLSSGGAETAQRRATTSLAEAYDLDRDGVLTTRIKNYLRQLNARTSAPTVLTAIFGLADAIDPSGQLTDELRGSTHTAVEQQQLVSQSAELQSAVRAKEQEVRSLSLEAARERALAEYHKKVADSLFFVGLIDSLRAVQQEQALAEQAATIQLQESELALQDARSRTMLVVIISALVGLLLVTGFYLQSRRLNRRLKAEKERSEQLLLNILPKDVAEELKTTGQVEPRFYELGTVLFTDFVGFSAIAKTLSSDRLIK
ncbi:MAG: hypothetical protein KDC54_22645, partial [Lewinella sp.]|nr:hypothetical protein [Lewinella sp.]